MFRSRWGRALLGVSLLAALAAGSALVVRRASAATLTVCSTCAYRSINDALAAAAPGDTVRALAGTYGPNEPGATTPDTVIRISKPVTVVGAGAGVSIINDAPANQGTATAGVIVITTPSVAGDISVVGFTVEGAIVNDSNDDGILLTVNDTRAGDTVSIHDNLFYGDTTLDPQLLADQTDAIYVYGSAAATQINRNAFRGVFRAALVEGNPGPVSFSNNDVNLHALYDLSTTPPTLAYWAEGLLFLGDSGAVISSAQTVSGNTFERYAGMGVGVDAGYCCGLVGAYTDVNITANTFNNLGVAASQSSTPDDADIYLHGFGTSNGAVTSTISGVTIRHNTFNLSSDTGHGYAVRLNGSIGANNVISQNALRGAGAAPPPAGVLFTNPSSSAAVSVNANLITGFVAGLRSDALPAGAQVSARQNCIAGNSAAGVTVASGATLMAANNWWGAASGPYNTSTNPTGTGDAVSDGVIYTPYLTKAPAACSY
ncbi:MAG TPA: hypothetical protein VF808_15260 [Ktedonobacterales bacterium]